MKIDLPYICYILEVIKDIENSMEKLSKTRFNKNKDKQHAHVRRLEIIGEAVKNISQDLKSQYSLVGWKKFSELKSIYTRNYFGFNVDIVWSILKNDIPILQKELKNISKLEKEE